MKKYIFILTLAMLSACKSADQKAAESLIAQAREYIDSGAYTSAITLLDSLNSSYPAQIEAREESSRMKAEAIRLFSEQQIVMADSIIAVLTPRMSEYEGKFEHVPGKDGMAGYFVDKRAYAADFASTTGVEARVSDADYSFYMVASSSKRKIGITQISLATAGGAEMSSQALDPNDSRSGDTDKFGIDLATFSTSEVSALAEWAMENASEITTLTLRGKLGDITENISPDKARAIGYTWEFSQVAYRLQHARRLSDKLNRQLIIARDHSVNLEKEP